MSGSADVVAGRAKEGAAAEKLPDAIRIGLCGIGRTGFGRIRKEVSPLRECRVVAGFDVIRERAEQLAGVFGSAVHTTYEDLLGDDGVDVVVVATRSNHHAAMAIQGLEAGKHVIVEKPMGINLAEADALIAAAGRAKGKLFVRHNRRFEPALAETLAAMQAGKLGRVFRVQLRVQDYTRRNDWQTLKEFGGGQLLNWGPHVVDWALQVMGCPAAEVWGDLKRVVAGGDAEDHVKVMIRGINGIVVDIEISGAAALADVPWHVSGSRGALMVDTQQQCHLRYLREEPGPVQASAETPTHDHRYRGIAEGWIEERFAARGVHPGQFWIEVYRSLRQGKEFPVTLEQAREVMRVIELARRGSPCEQSIK